MKNIHDSVSKIIEMRLRKYLNKGLNREVCTLIYQDIFDCFVDIFQESNVRITNESMNLLAQMYYDSVKINGSQELDPNIFEQRAKMENIETKELALLSTMLNKTPFANILISEIKLRS